MTTTIDLTIDGDPLTLGETATREDLAAYARQLGAELGEECGCAVTVHTALCLTPSASGPEPYRSEVLRTYRQWAQGDEWIHVLGRALAADAVAEAVR